MGLGLLYGSPKTYLTSNWYVNGDILAVWIEHEIPCFVGNVPVQYTDALLAEFMKHRIPQAIVRDAFSKLEKRGIRFDWGVSGAGIYAGVGPAVPVNRSGVPAAPQMRAVSKGEADRMKRYTFEEYERRYVLAIRTNDAAGAEAVIAAVLELLWGVAKGYSKTRQAGRNEKMVEWEEFNMAVNEALERAQTLQTHVRYLSREELRSLRETQTPSGLRHVSFRLAARVTTTTVPPARRVRR